MTDSVSLSWQSIINFELVCGKNLGNLALLSRDGSDKRQPNLQLDSGKARGSEEMSPKLSLNSSIFGAESNWTYGLYKKDFRRVWGLRNQLNMPSKMQCQPLRFLFLKTEWTEAMLPIYFLLCKSSLELLLFNPSHDNVVYTILSV